MRTHSSSTIISSVKIQFVAGQTLRSLDAAYVSLLDCTVQNVTSLPGNVLRGVALHGLVISSGEIVEVHRDAFEGFAAPLQALGLPNNKLTSVPTDALENLPELDRLDLSSNRMKSLDGRSFSVSLLRNTLILFTRQAGQ